MKKAAGPLLLALPLILLLALPLVALVLRTPLQLPSNEAWDAIAVSLKTTLAATVAILIFGTPLALFLSQRRRILLETLVTLPAVLPPSAAGLALLLALGRKGLLGNLLHQVGVSLPFTAAAVIIAQIYVAVPFFVRPTAAALRALSPELEEAATLDGATYGHYVRQIALPLVRRPLLAALSLAWARALGEFGATILFAGNRPGVTQTLPLAIYEGFESDLNSAAALSTLLLAVAVGVLALSQIAVKQDTPQG